MVRSVRRPRASRGSVPVVERLVDLVARRGTGRSARAAAPGRSARVERGDLGDGPPAVADVLEPLDRASGPRRTARAPSSGTVGADDDLVLEVAAAPAQVGGVAAPASAPTPRSAARSNPVSSRSSRTAVSTADSPSSTPPPGSSHQVPDSGMTGSIVRNSRTDPAASSSTTRTDERSTSYPPSAGVGH